MARRYERVRTVVETSVGVSRLEQSKASVAEPIAKLRTGFEASANLIDSGPSAGPAIVSHSVV